MSRLKMKEVLVVNRRDVDIFVRDAYGKTHLLFPRAEKVIMTITENSVARHSPEPSRPEPIQEK